MPKGLAKNPITTVSSTNCFALSEAGQVLLSTLAITETDTARITAATMSDDSGLIGIIFVGLQPIIALLRPEAIDAYLSGAMTCLVETMIFFPIMLIELKLMNSNKQKVTLLQEIWEQWALHFRQLLGPRWEQ